MTDTYEKLIALLDEFGATYRLIDHVAPPQRSARRRLAYLSRSSNSFAHIMFNVRETAAEQ
jgi:hypothetical protein